MSLNLWGIMWKSNQFPTDCLLIVRNIKLFDCLEYFSKDNKCIYKNRNVNDAEKNNE